MTDHLVTPDREIEFAGKAYLLRGSFNTLKMLQNGFQRDVIDLYISLLSMRQDEIAKFISLALKGSGYELTEDEAGESILELYDLTKPPYMQLKADLLAWLTIAVTPKDAREKKRAEVEEMVAKLRQSVSRGKNTEASA